jgi:hypothetical protein
VVLVVAVLARLCLGSDTILGMELVRINFLTPAYGRRPMGFLVERFIIIGRPLSGTNATPTDYVHRSTARTVSSKYQCALRETLPTQSVQCDIDEVLQFIRLIL